MKKKTSTLFRRGTAYLLALMLCVSTVQVTAFAADGDTPPEENASAPTVVQPDEPQSTPEPSDYNAEASSSSKEEVNVTLKDDGSLEVDGYPTPEVNKEGGTKYEGYIQDENKQPVYQPASGSSSIAPAKLEGTITETSSEPSKEEDKGEGTEGQPAEGEEPKDKVISEGTIKGDEKTDDMDRTPSSQPSPEDTKHENAAVKNPGDVGFNNTVSVDIKDENRVVKKDNDGNPVLDKDGNPVYETDKEGNFIYKNEIETEITSEEKVQKGQEILKEEYDALKPDGYNETAEKNPWTYDEKSGEYSKKEEPSVSEDGKTTTEKTTTWKKSESGELGNGYEYQVENKETTVVTQTGLPAPSLAPEKPENDPDNGVTVTDSEDGSYTAVKITKDADGKETTETVTVKANGEYTISKTYLGEKGETITDTKTVSNGTMTVTTTTVITTVTKHTVDRDKNIEPKPGDKNGSVSVDVTVTEGDGHGALKTEGLQPDMDATLNGKKFYQVKNIKQNDKLFVRSGPSTDYPQVIDPDTKNLLGFDNGEIFCVLEVSSNGKWGRIGKDQWISLNAKWSDEAIPYKVTGDYNVRVDSNSSSKKVGEVKPGDIIYVVEQSTNGWLKTTDGYWISGKSSTSSNVSVPFDPKDGTTNNLTDLYGLTNKVMEGRTEENTPGLSQNDKYFTSGTPYLVDAGTVLNSYSNGSIGLLSQLPTGTEGVVYITETKVINGVEYGLIGNAKWSQIAVPMDKLTKIEKAEQGKFLFYGEYGLSSAVGVDLEDKKGEDSYYNVHQFVIKDEYGKDHYVYCSDLSVHPVSGTNYGMTNVEDADYLKENADIIKAIATNGYWGTSSDTGSMESFKQWLKNSGYVTDVNDLNWLTPGLAMSVTQAAIWHFGNSKNAGTERELDETTPFEKDKYGNIVTDSEMESLNALYKFLTNPDNAKDLTKDAAESTKLLNASSVQNVSVTVTKADSGTSTVTTDNSEVKDTYDASISFKLDIDPATLMNNTSIVVTLIGTDGKELKDEKGNTITHKYALAGTSGVAKGMEGIKNFFSNGTGEKEKTYTLTVPGLPGGVTLNLTLEGAQKIQKGAYLISAQGGFDKSQTFISVESGTRDFNLNMKLNLSVESAQATVTTTTTPEVTKTEQIHREWSWDTKTTQKVVEPDPEEPENPTTPPEDPTTPPPTPRDPDPDPSDDPEIPDEPVPLTYIPDEPVPQAPLPPEDLIDIFDGDVPLASPYGTGDNSTVWYLIAVISVAGLFGLRLLECKANGENAK